MASSLGAIIAGACLGIVVIVAILVILFSYLLRQDSRVAKHRRQDSRVAKQVDKDPPSILLAETSAKTASAETLAETLAETSAETFRRQSRLRCLVTGMQHSGTTILSRLIMNAPEVMGAFEGGVLLAPVPSELPQVKPFWDWLQDPVEKNGWAIPRAELERLAATASSHADVYRGIYELSPVINKAYEIVDKCPEYVWYLREVLQRSPGIPLVLIVKEKEAQIKSFTKRGFSGEWALERYLSAMVEIESALKAYPDRILKVHYTDLLNNPSATMRRVFRFLDLAPWRDDYATMAPLNAKYAALGLEPVTVIDSGVASSNSITSTQNNEEEERKLRAVAARFAEQRASKARTARFAEKRTLRASKARTARAIDLRMRPTARV
jgi:hypothetical protein